MVANILSPPPPAYPRPRGLDQNVGPFFLKVVMLHIKLKGMSKEDHASTYSFITQTIGPWGVVKRSKYFFLLK